MVTLDGEAFYQKFHDLGPSPSPDPTAQSVLPATQYPMVNNGLDEAPYYTGAQVLVAIGSTALLEAISVVFNDSHQHTPYFGYRSTHYDHVFPGRVLVQGTLVLNLLDTQLLNLVCQASTDLVVDPPSDGAAQLANDASPALALDADLTGKFRDREMMEKIEAVRQSMLEQNAPKPPARVPNALEVLQWLKGQQKFGIDITLHYGDLTEINKPWNERRYSNVETINGVIFTGENRRVEVTSDIIAQAYTFFAREIT